MEEIQFYDVWEDKEGGETPWFKDLVPDFKVLHDKTNKSQNVQIPGGFSKGIAFRSFITNAPNYLAWLSQECNKRGIPIVRHRLSALDQAYDLHGLGLSNEKGKKVDLVVNCSALGSRSLIGVEDESTFPAACVLPPRTDSLPYQLYIPSKARLSSSKHQESRLATCILNPSRMQRPVRMSVGFVYMCSPSCFQ